MQTLRRVLAPRPLAPLTHPDERAAIWQRTQRVSRRAVELSRSVSAWESPADERDAEQR